MSWAVACTHPNLERRVERGLTDQGFTSYLPRYRTERSPSPRLLFPGYVFVLVADAWRSITGTRGVSRVIMAGDRPAMLPDTEVQALRDRTGEDGFIQLPRRQLTVGQAVNIEFGTFGGWTAIYDGQAPRERCFVLLSIMGRLTRASVPGEAVTAA